MSAPFSAAAVPTGPLAPHQTAEDAAAPPGLDEYFEGPEKLLEVWFVAPPATHSPRGRDASAKRGLRALTREQLSGLLSHVQCKILSSRHNRAMDSYVLSESSMFVTEDRFILKTCGTTTLLRAVRHLFDLAASVGLTDVQEFFYSRKQLGYPSLQEYPHDSFDSEVEFLQKELGLNGVSSVFGDQPDQQWHIYAVMGDGPGPLATTLEILMSGLAVEATRPYFKTHDSDTSDTVVAAAGIDRLLPEAELDGHLFDPCGYSVNGTIDDRYFTIHVTPQEGYSYASFETNIDAGDYSPVIQRVIQTFQPKHAVITLARCQQLPPARLTVHDSYRVLCKQRLKVGYYDVQYLHYNADDHQPAAPSPAASSSAGPSPCTTGTTTTAPLPTVAAAPASVGAR